MGFDTAGGEQIIVPEPAVSGEARVCPKKAWASSEKGRAYYQAYHKAYGATEKGKATRAAAARKQRRRGRELVIQLKSRPCMDCNGAFHHCQMQFDHRPETDKRFEIGNQYGLGVRAILKEAAKCDVVCANCHSLRTWRRRHPGEAAQ